MDRYKMCIYKWIHTHNSTTANWHLTEAKQKLPKNQTDVAVFGTLALNNEPT